jgi:flagellar biosynthesis/type III secretory pathway M-ring protein FliF/YscJ
MESYHELLVTLARLLSSVVVIVLFFMFIVRPLLDYFIVNREIEQRKRLHEELLEDVPPVDLPKFRDVVDGGSAPIGDIPEPQARAKGSDMETLTRLASSDPDKASDLVKQWVNSDSSRSR